ncbi:MAG: fimbrillin family protein [Bacteroidales bacterium]|nr:fimbrillin family protein [Bacteroidales bacterium]
MKKFSLYAVLAAATLAGVSCSNDDVLVQSPNVDKPIEFGTYTGRTAALAPTRAHSVETAATLAADGGFGVFAFYTNNEDYSNTATPNFMYNQQVTSTDGVNWAYSPLKYWPNDETDKLTFFAYAPYANHASTTDNFEFSTNVAAGDPLVTFTINNEVKNQQDLLWSNSATDNIIKNTTNGVGVGEKTLFEFKHALSRIGFTVKAITDEVIADATNPNNLDAATTIVLKEIRLTADKVVGNTAPTAGIFYTTGTLNLNNRTAVAAWTAQSGTQYFTVNNDDFEAQSSSLYDNDGFVLNSGNATNVNKLNTDDSYIMIIPQNLVGTGFIVYVEYDVITVDSNLTGGKSIVTNHISTPVEINFLSGKSYQLNLQLGMTSVKVDATVANWVDAADTNVDLPVNQN